MIADCGSRTTCPEMRLAALRATNRQPCRPRVRVRNPQSFPPSAEDLHQPSNRIIKLVHHPFLEWDDPVVRDLDVLRADLRTALRDVAVPDAVLAFELGHAILDVERMHL